MSFLLCDFPDLCLLTIFDYLPLGQLLADVPLVCRRWNALQPSALSRRRSLSLILKNDKTENISLTSHFPSFSSSLKTSHFVLQRPLAVTSTNVLAFKNTSFSPKTSKEPHRLLRTFPNGFARLEIVLETSTNVVKFFLLPLLASWSCRIKSLSVVTSFYKQINSSAQREDISSKLYNLLQAINSLESLEVLSLHFSDYLHYTLSARVDLPILKQLRSFTFYSLDRAEVIFDSLRRYADSDNNRLQEITLNQSIFSQEALTIFAQLPPSARSKFSTLKLSFQSYLQNVEEVTPTVLRSIAFTFPALRCLSFPLDRKLSLLDLGRCLANLNSTLSELVLSLDFTEAKRPSLLAENRTPAEEVVPLACVTRLSMTLYIDHSHTDAQCAHFGRVFPNLRTLRLDSDHMTACAGCRVDSFRCLEANEEVEKKSTCLKKLLEPWKKACPKLTHFSARYGKVVVDHNSWKEKDNN